jgi:hypothetical protein
MDGLTTAGDLAQRHRIEEGLLREILEPALVSGLVADMRSGVACSGLVALSRLEAKIDTLMQDLVYEGEFWRKMTETPQTLPREVYYGFAIENWFFLFHENEFDSAVLSYPMSWELRAKVNDFYQEEHRHDDIVLRAFQPLGIGKEDLVRARPLPTTTSLIRLLSWWARTDPLFFMATIGILEGRLDPEGNVKEADGKLAYDSFLAAADCIGLDPAFVEPLRAHARVNASHGHASVSRELFAHLDGVDEPTVRRWLGKVHLFVECYAAFYDGVLAYYSDPGRPLLRRIPEWRAAL